MENKKVKNATDCFYDGIHFKSVLEKDAYVLLSKAGFLPEYEKHTFHIWEGKNFSVPIYDLHKDRKLKKKVWGLNKYKPIAIKYTPDFIFTAKDKTIILEAKGFPNDRYQYVKKMFRSHMEKYIPNSIFFEVHTKKQIEEAIKIIQSL